MILMHPTCVGGRTLKWLKVKVPRYREGERGWEPKGTPWPTRTSEITLTEELFLRIFPDRRCTQ